MSDLQIFFGVLTVVAFAVALPLAFVSWFRILRAKTRREYWKNIALFAGPILLMFFFANLAGLTPTAEVPPQPVPDPMQLLSKLPPAQLLFLGLAAATWIVGGNVLFVIHKRRVGKSWWQMMNPLDPPFKDFNAKEWGTLGILLVLSFAFAGIALSAHQ